MAEIKEVLDNTIQSIDETSDLFYRQKDQEGYQKLNEMIGCISNTMDLLLKSNAEEKVSEIYLEIIKKLDEALSAMEAKDTILLADIMQYEIKERFMTLYETIK